TPPQQNLRIYELTNNLMRPHTNEIAEAMVSNEDMPLAEEAIDENVKRKVADQIIAKMKLSLSTGGSGRKRDRKEVHGGKTSEATQGAYPPYPATTTSPKFFKTNQNEPKRLTSALRRSRPSKSGEDPPTSTRRGGGRVQDAIVLDSDDDERGPIINKRRAQRRASSSLFTEDGSVSLTALKGLLARGVDVIGYQLVAIANNVGFGSFFEDLSQVQISRYNFAIRPTEISSLDDARRCIVLHIESANDDENEPKRKPIINKRRALRRPQPGPLMDLTLDEPQQLGTATRPTEIDQESMRILKLYIDALPRNGAAPAYVRNYESAKLDLIEIEDQVANSMDSPLRRSCPHDAPLRQKVAHYFVMRRRNFLAPRAGVQQRRFPQTYNLSVPVAERDGQLMDNVMESPASRYLRGGVSNEQEEHEYRGATEEANRGGAYPAYAASPKPKPEQTDTKKLASATRKLTPFGSEDPPTPTRRRGGGRDVILIDSDDEEKNPIIVREPRQGPRIRSKPPTMDLTGDEEDLATPKADVRRRLFLPGPGPSEGQLVRLQFLQHPAIECAISLRQFTDDSGNASLINLKSLLARGVDVTGPQPVAITGNLGLRNFYHEFLQVQNTRHNFAIRPAQVS
ncbi:hypothetical protein HII31_06204, partial [Pseudocercospora fuligena]